MYLEPRSRRVVFNKVTCNLPRIPAYVLVEIMERSTS